MVCGVSSLGIDHTGLLGDTMEKIAWQKGGIFKVTRQSWGGRYMDGLGPKIQGSGGGCGTVICILLTQDKVLGISGVWVGLEQVEPHLWP